MDYELYKRLRVGRHPLMPRPVSSITSLYKLGRGGRKHAYPVGHSGELALDPTDLLERGFDPAHTTARVRLETMEWGETPEQQLMDMGFAVESSPTRARPDHEALSCKFRDRWDKSRWISLPQRERRHWLCGPAWDGMARGVRAQVAHEVIREVCEEQVEWVQDIRSGDIQSYDVIVEVAWRGEAVGRAGVGFCQIRGTNEEVSAIIDEDDLVGRALDEAEAWADKAFAKAQERIMASVQDIALLPPRAIETVRAAYEAAFFHPFRRRA
jgi:hypothetical protein